MELKEARSIAAAIRLDRHLHGAIYDDPPTRSGSAIIVLDDRIGELEQRIDEMFKRENEVLGDQGFEYEQQIEELKADASRLATMCIEKNTENSSLILKVAKFEAQRDRALDNLEYEYKSVLKMPKHNSNKRR